MTDCTEKPTCGELDNWTATILGKDRRMDDRLLKVSGHWIVCQERKGQSKLMGSIHCTQIPFILTAAN